MLMTTAHVHLLHSKGFKQSSYSDHILYGKDKDGREWQAELGDHFILFREVKNYRLDAPTQYSEAFFNRAH